MLQSGAGPGELAGAAARLTGWLLAPLGLYILVSALDDLVLDVLWLLRIVRRKLSRPRAAPVLAPPPERPVAILIPCWHEAEVIASMLDHNLAALRYSQYRVFVGVYPNDPATAAAVGEAAARHAKLRLVCLPHDGPTSKADCLNWICRAIEEEEQSMGEEFACVVLHDAEDLIHPDELGLFNAHLDQAHFLQLPVLALPTPPWELTHGVYCDDFAESQSKDLVTRQLAGAFVPGCGVGTALRRDALRQLAVRCGEVFDPRCLTEDYDLGLRAFKLGLRQLFLPLLFDRGEPLATREYFPRRWSQAVRQRSRWVAGNCLQGWEHHGWRGPWQQAWFLWRDRKGLWGSPLSLLCNLVLLAGVIAWGLHLLRGGPWVISSVVRLRPWLAWVLALNLCFVGLRLPVRMAVSGRIYGWSFALWAPVRLLWGNFINAAATLRALQVYAASKLGGRRLAWTKTSHAYPTPGSLLAHKRTLPEVFEFLGFGPAQFYEQALAARPASTPAADFFLTAGLVTEEQFMDALCLQQSLPRVHLSPASISPRTRRTIPQEAIRSWRVLPFRVEDGTLHVASAAVPTDEMISHLRLFTRLEIRFHLISPREFEELQHEDIHAA
jgi:adsorption protein B